MRHLVDFCSCKGIKTITDLDMGMPSSTLHARLIYNPSSGSGGDKSSRQARVLDALHRAGIAADLFVPGAEEEIAGVVAEAIQQGADLVIACGGDGTVESAANGLVNTGVPLGIIPAGTRNNVARSLGIPLNITAAAGLLRRGTPRAIGTGYARAAEGERWFLETFTVGIFSALYPHADAFQKGEWARALDLFKAFLSAPSARVYLSIDDGAERMMTDALAVLGVNMPSTGANFRLAADIAYDDEHLDIFVYDRLDKLDLLVYGIDVMTGMPEDTTIQRRRAHHVHIRTDPPLPVMADGFFLGAGEVDVRSAPHSLLVITGVA
jgi:diacylglycerol kinase (ATP)